MTSSKQPRVEPSATQLLIVFQFVVQSCPGDKHETRCLARAEAIDVAFGVDLFIVVQPFEGVAAQIAVDSTRQDHVGIAFGY